MAEALPPSNGSASGSGLDIPAPDFVAQGKAMATGMQQGGWWERHWASFWASVIAGITLVVSQIVGNMDAMFALFVNIMGAAQGNNTSGFFKLVSALLSDLLGVDFSQEAVQAAWQRGGSMAAFRDIGADYWKALVKQLGPPNPLTPEGGLASAQGFMAYLLGFSVRESNIATIVSLIPEEYRIVDGIEEYGHAMQRNLGFGRMARQALHPLIQTLITDPLQWYVNQQYQPKLMGEGAATRAYNRGLIDNGAWYQEMSYAGYNPARSAALQAEYLGHLSAPDVQTLREQGTLSDQQAVAALQNSSYDPTTAAQLLAVFDANSTRTYVSQQIATLRTQRLNGFLDDAGFQAEVNNLAIGAPAQGAVKHAMAVEMGLPRKTLTWTEVQEAVGLGLMTLDAAAQFLIQQGYSQDAAAVLLQIPRNKLTLAQMQSAFTEGLLDSTDVSTWLKAEGYSDDAAQILWLQTLLKLSTETAKIAVAQYVYNKAVAKAEKAGEPPPPKPPILAQGPT